MSLCVAILGVLSGPRPLLGRKVQWNVSSDPLRGMNKIFMGIRVSSMLLTFTNGNRMFTCIELIHLFISD